MLPSVRGIGAPARPAGGPRRAGAAGFAIPSGAAKPATAPIAASAAAPLEGMLALQEAEGDAVRDRAARKHGQALLAALARLQSALLGGGDDPAALHEVAALAAHMPPAPTPALAAALAGVSLRAQVELARRGL